MVVQTNLLDMWARPAFNSERVSQLLWGEPLEGLSEKSGFTRVRQPDGYSGWADSRFLTPVTKSLYRLLTTDVDGVVSAITARTFGDTDGHPMLPYFLYYGTRLKTESTKSGYVQVVLPDKDPLYLKKGNIRPINRRMASVSGTKLLAEAKKFLGVPYLWGGVTSSGFDCSGFVRALFSAFGIYLPRDTRDQIRVGREVDRDSIRTGDLLFFRRHVGLAIGGSRIIHASQGGGGVRINGLTPNEEDYRSDLDEAFEQARRVL